MTLLKNGGYEGFVTANDVNLGKTSIESSRKDIEQNVWSLGLIIWTVINAEVITPAYLRPELRAQCAEANTARLEMWSLRV